MTEREKMAKYNTCPDCGGDMACLECGFPYNKRRVRNKEMKK